VRPHLKTNKQKTPHKKTQTKSERIRDMAQVVEHLSRSSELNSHYWKKKKRNVYTVLMQHCKSKMMCMETRIDEIL
jgi:hypothetical protein